MAVIALEDTEADLEGAFAVTEVVSRVIIVAATEVVLNLASSRDMVASEAIDFHATEALDITDLDMVAFADTKQ